MPDDIIPDKVDIRRKKVKNISLRVLPDGSLRVTAPPGANIDRFVAEHQAWIDRKRKRLRCFTAGHESCRHLFLFDGVYCHLLPGEECSLDPAGGEVRYSGGAPLKAALKEWLRQEIESRLDRNAERMKVSSGRRVGIRMQRTRWGSCSGRGNLNFNLRLAALPDWLREYVVIHELAHLRVPSHSPAFWSIVAEHSPDYREAEAELRRYWVIIENNAIWQQIRDYWS